MNNFTIIQKSIFVVLVTGFTVIACLIGIQPAEAQWEDISLASVHLHGDVLPEITFNKSGNNH